MENQEKIKAIGVTTLIRRFKPPFDKESMAAKIANRQGVSKEDILEDWDLKRRTAINRGNAVHKYIELSLKGEAFGKEDFKAYDNYCHQWSEWYNDHEDIYQLGQSEVKVFDRECKIVGTIDQVALNKSTGALVLIDWKTNSSFSTDSERCLLNPFSHLPDSSLVDVSLQLHLYARLARGKLLMGAAANYDLPMELVCVYLQPNGYTRYDCFDLAEDASVLMQIRRGEIK